MLLSFKLKDVDFEVFANDFTYKLLADYDHKPVAEEVIKDEMGGELIVAEFEGPSFNLIFHNEDEKPLSTIEIAEEDLMLFNEQIMGYDIESLEALLKENKKTNYEIEKFTWGETGLIMEEEGVDFYFDNDKLTAVSIYL